MKLSMVGFPSCICSATALARVREKEARKEGSVRGGESRHRRREREYTQSSPASSSPLQGRSYKLIIC
jgi:hypothetical protein